MPVFDNSPGTFQRLDWQILQNGWSSQYWNQTILEEDIRWFKNNGFRVVEFDCTSWTDRASIHSNLKKALNFPDYYGNNLNALNDCLSDMEIGNVGFIIVFLHFDTIEKELGCSLIDIFANNSRRHMLFGEKLITLIQVDDPEFNIEPEASPVLWNSKEHLNSSRGLGSH